VRVGEPIWYSRRVFEPNAEIATYEKPVKLTTRFNYITVMPAASRGYAEVLAHGENVQNEWTVIANGRAFGGVFKEGDLFWVDGAKPLTEFEEEFGYGTTANAVVKSVSPVNLSIAITLQRNQKQEPP
jgi:hypothetical protein